VRVAVCGGVGLEIIVRVSVPCAVARKFTGFIGREADLVRMNSDIEFLIVIGTLLFLWWLRERVTERRGE
jgi:hypothetical protein